MSTNKKNKQTNTGRDKIKLQVKRECLALAQT